VQELAAIERNNTAAHRQTVDDWARTQDAPLTEAKLAAVSTRAQRALQLRGHPRSPRYNDHDTYED